MSVIQTIRDRGTWIIFVIIALALIAFILQDGARRNNSSFSNSSVITKVNGEEIQRGDFEEKLKTQEQMYASQGATRDQLIGNVWNQEVDRLVIKQEIDKLGLVYSIKELNDVLFSENSPLKQEFTDPATGIFNADDAKRAFAQIKKSKNTQQIKMINQAYIDPTIQNGLITKYQHLLIQASYIPKYLTESQIKENSTLASISYVYSPYSSVSDSLAKVTDAEIIKYVKNHPTQYQKEEETRTINYVTFNAGPSSTDSAEVLNQLNSLETEFKATSDVKSFLGKVGTEIPFYDSYFSKNKMQMPLKDSIISLSAGEIFGPYLDANNYVYAKMISIKQWPDSVRVRHILVGTSDPRSGQIIRTDTVGKKLADSILAAINTGADFNSLVMKYSDDQGSKNNGGVYEYFPQGQMVIPFNDYVFDHSVGTKGVVKTNYGYHVVEILGQKNINPAYKVAYLSKSILPSIETTTAANTAASQFVVNSTNSIKFNENANKANLSVLIATDIKENDFTISTIGGQARNFVRWIYEHKEGDISEPFEIGNQFIVANIKSINEKGLLNAFEARPLVETIIKNQKKAKLIIDTKIKGSTLEQIAQSTGSIVLRSDSISYAAPFITGIGNEPKIVGAAFNKTIQGKVSSPIAGLTGVFALKGESIFSNPANNTSTDLTIQNLSQARKMGIYRSIESLRKSSDIKDFRFKFY